MIKHFSNDVVKKTIFNRLNSKVAELEKKIVALENKMSTLIHKSQYHTDKQNLEIKIEYVDKKVGSTTS